VGHIFVKVLPQVEGGITTGKIYADIRPTYGKIIPRDDTIFLNSNRKMNKKVSIPVAN